MQVRVRFCWVSTLRFKKLIIKYLYHENFKQQTSKLVIIVTLAGLFFYACDALIDVSPKGALSDEVLANQQGVEALLIGVYGALDGQMMTPERREATDVSNWVYGSIAGADAHKGESLGNTNGYVQIGNMNSSPAISFFDGKWQALYEGITRANSVLSVLEDVEDMTEEEKNRVAAEARFLRGHFYFDLKTMFDMVPWIDENTDDVNQPNDQDIWPNIEADFQYALITFLKHKMTEPG
jgi:starch-binding outer membrane protein, SusD/RagB family